MSNAIQFLERLGRFPLSSRCSVTSYADNVSSLPIDDDQKQALLGLNVDRLNALLGGRSKMMMQVWAPMEDTPDGDEQQDKDGDDNGDGDPPDNPVGR